MGLFSKKYDIKDTPLRVVFNEEERNYVCYYGNSVVSYNDLNRKSKKIIDSKNKELLTNPNLLQEELEKIKTWKRFDKLRSLGYLCDSFEYLGPANGTMSKEMETLLSNLVSEENILLGIHRVGANLSDENIEDILINGLEITGHLGGAANSTKELKNNVGYYPNNKTIIKELMYADKYKNSKGSILIRIPDTDLTQNIFIIDAEGRTRLNPKYIVGYVPLYKNHHLENIITPHKINTQKNNYSFQNKNERPTYSQEEIRNKTR